MNSDGAPAWSPVWRRAVTPADVADGRLMRVPAGAVTVRPCGDALVDMHWDEVQRRRCLGAGPVRSLPLLDVLLNLPLEQPIEIGDLTSHEERLLRRAPAGCVDIGDRFVTRNLQRPLTVAAVVVAAPTWRIGLRKVARFGPFAQRIVVLPKALPESMLWEAEVAGIGVWIATGDGPVEQLAPGPFIPRYVKAAGWRFAESAYGQGLAAGVMTNLSQLAGQWEPTRAGETP